jgi:stearoyl-CoA desaturase (delta-9 desaturase)
VSARHGLAWYEFDISWITLKMLNAIGVVSDLKVARVREPLPEEQAA